MARVLVVQSGRTGGLRRWEQPLATAGLQVDVVHGWDGALPPADLEHDALIVLGGGYLPDEDDRAPWLVGTRALVGQALEDRVPYFGICLGGQMLAHVAGGEVRGRWGTPEYGSTEITLLDTAADDPLLHDLAPTQWAIERHQDAVTRLPDGAVHLARSAQCPYQAFRVGELAWGVQFHPETLPDRILEWNGDDLAARGLDRHALHSAAVRDDAVAEPTWRLVADRFAALVVQRGARVPV